MEPCGPEVPVPENGQDETDRTLSLDDVRAVLRPDVQIEGNTPVGIITDSFAFLVDLFKLIGQHPVASLVSGGLIFIGGAILFRR